MALFEREYLEVIAIAAECGIGSSKVYDALIMRRAEKAGAETVCT